MSVAKDGWTRGVVIAVVCAVCALVLASAGPACGQARVRTLNVTVPREIQDDLRDRAKQFVLWVYPTADADAIHKACSDSFVREIQTVRGLTSVLGPTVGLAGRPRVGVAFPSGGRRSLGTKEPPPGVTLPQRKEPLSRAEAQAIASGVRDRISRGARIEGELQLVRSGLAEIDGAYYFTWRERGKEARRFSGAAITVDVRRRDGLVTHVRLEDRLPEPAVSAQTIAARARGQIDGFRPQYLTLRRTFRGGVSWLVWQYEVPPSPGGGPEDRTMWDAATGKLLYSVVLGGGSPRKPHRAKAFGATPTPEEAARLLKAEVERRLRSLKSAKP